MEKEKIIFGITLCFIASFLLAGIFALFRKDSFKDFFIHFLISYAICMASFFLTGNE